MWTANHYTAPSRPIRGPRKNNNANAAKKNGHARIRGLPIIRRTKPYNPMDMAKTMLSIVTLRHCPSAFASLESRRNFSFAKKAPRCRFRSAP